MPVRLFVGNLAYGVTEEEVRELFSVAGSVSQVRLPTDRETGKPRGFAFVDFDDRSQAEEAIRRFHQYMFKDRALEVNEAREREARSAAGPDARPLARPVARPGPSPERQPTWSGPIAADADDDPVVFGQPRRTFGTGPSTRDKRKQKGRASKEERAPKLQPRERGGGRSLLGSVLDDDEDDQALDDFALWAREDAKNRDEE